MSIRDVDAVTAWDANPWQAGAALLCYSIAAGACNFWPRAFTVFERPLRTQLGDKTVIDSVVPIYLLADALSGPFFGKLAGRYGVQCNLTISTAIVVATTLLFTTGVTQPTLYIGYFLGGVASAATVHPCTMAAVQLMPFSKQGRASSIVYFVCAIFAAVGLVPIKEVISYHGARVGYVAQGFLQAACLGLCSIFLASPLVGQANVAARKASSFSIGNSKTCMFHLGLYLTFVAGAGTYYFNEVQLCPILEETLPQDTAITTMALPIILIGEAFARLWWGHMACKYPVTICYVAGMAIVTASLNSWALSSGLLSLDLIAAAISYWSVTCHWVLMPVLVARIFPPEHATFCFTLLGTSGVIAGSIGGPMTAELSSSLGWSRTLHIISLLPALSAMVLIINTCRYESRALSLTDNSSSFMDNSLAYTHQASMHQVSVHQAWMDGFWTPGSSSQQLPTEVQMSGRNSSELS